MAQRKLKTRNKFEASGVRQLRKLGVRFTYETEKIPYVLAGHYIPDFIVVTSRGKIYVEFKGYLRPYDRRKLAAIKRQHPNLDIRIVFYKATKTNIRWSERVGYTYAIGRIPGEWFT